MAVSGDRPGLMISRPLDQALASHAPEDIGKPRLPIDRVFNIRRRNARHRNAGWTDLCGQKRWKSRCRSQVPYPRHSNPQYHSQTRTATARRQSVE
jgi:hypothetical protein